MGDLDFAAVAKRAVDRAERSAQPRRLDPGKYTVILEPAAVASLLEPLQGSLSAREADEGRSFFSRPGGGNRTGEKLFSDKVTIVSDPASPLSPAQPFDADGLPLRPTTWIDKGVVKELVWSRAWARKQGREPIGAPSSFIVLGGSSTVEEMVKSTDKGILVTRFFYVRSVDPRTMMLTGLTRDGTFWIEKGEIAYPVNNFRFNESPVTLFANTELLSTPVRMGEGIVVPAIKATGFNMASVSAAV
jgi:predicted Zn-dependent protease